MENKSQQITAYFDGACLGNPDGVMGFGAYICGFDQPISIWDGRNPKEGNSSIVAEFLALHLLLENIMNTNNHTINIYGDSKFVIDLVNGRYKIGKDKRYTKVATEVVSLLDNLKLRNKVKCTWIPRSENEIADELSNHFIKMNYS